MSNSASQYRGLLWLFTGVGFLCFWAAFQGTRGLLSPAFGLLSGMTGVVSLFTGAWFGLKGTRIRIAERQKKADAIALITLAAVLKDRSEEELKGVIAKGGPAAEAAALVLERRRLGLRPSGTQQSMS